MIHVMFYIEVYNYIYNYRAERNESIEFGIKTGSVLQKTKLLLVHNYSDQLRCYTRASRTFERIGIEEILGLVTIGLCLLFSVYRDNFVVFPVAAWEKFFASMEALVKDVHIRVQLVHPHTL